MELKLHAITWNELDWMSMTMKLVCWSDMKWQHPLLFVKRQQETRHASPQHVSGYKMLFWAHVWSKLTRIEPDSPSDFCNEPTRTINFHLTSNCSSIVVFMECFHGLQKHLFIEWRGKVQELACSSRPDVFFSKIWVYRMILKTAFHKRPRTHSIKVH